MENVDDYDNIFERLHEKYAGKAEIAPEIELLLTLGGSAFMFHLTNSLLKSPSMDSVNMVAQNNPNFLSSMMGAMNQGMKEMAKPPNFSQPSTLQKPMETRGIRKEMKGPSIDTSLFAGTPVMNNFPKPPLPNDNVQQEYNSRQQSYYQDAHPIDEDDRFSIASSDSSMSSVSVKRISLRGKKQQQGLELNIS